MAALSTKRDTPERAGTDFSFGVAAAAVIHQGALVCLNASGFAVPGSVATTLIAVGRAEESVTGTATAGEAKVRVTAGVFRWANSTSGDLITIADIGDDCFVLDDQTVAKTNGSSARSRAGVIVDVDTLGVWVRMGLRS
ncbi:hypothetical protein [Polymorphobacter sp.]|uniref:hypothetical protein n=1 Tax=Polymorphobacter sp. TaxID=1909290 RepID=UPI003F702A09